LLDLADDLTDDAEDAGPEVDAIRRRRDRQMMGIGALTAALVFGTTAWWLGGRAARSVSADVSPTTRVVAASPTAPVTLAAVPAVAPPVSAAPTTAPRALAAPTEPSAPAGVAAPSPMTAASATTMASPVDSASPAAPPARRSKRKHPDHAPPTATFPD
jgi:hypothetical protein